MAADESSKVRMDKRGKRARRKAMMELERYQQLLKLSARFLGRKRERFERSCRRGEGEGRERSNLRILLGGHPRTYVERKIQCPGQDTTSASKFEIKILNVWGLPVCALVIIRT
jgi:hypothetical protein